MSASDRILKASQNKLHTAGFIGRQDMNIIDFVAIGDGVRAGQVLIKHDLHPPTAQQIEAFFIGQFGDTVKPNLTTVSVHKQEQCVSVVAHTQFVTRPVTDADNRDDMAYITASSYLDVQTKAVWDVAEDEAGRKFMLRRSDDNLTEIIETRKVRMQRSLPKLSSMKTAAVDCAKGDRVQFYDSGIVAYGTVTAVSGDKVTIQSVTGTATVDVMAVFKVTHKAPAEVSDEKNYLQKYFEDAFGSPEYASELTQTTTKELADGATGK